MVLGSYNNVQAVHNSLPNSSFNMEALSDLELVGLVSKVISELQNHLGVVDKNLAEFIIAQRVESDTFDVFAQKMTKIGGDSIPLSLLESIDRLARMAHPSMKVKSAGTGGQPDKQRIIDRARDFSGLALPDNTSGRKPVGDALAELEALAPQTENDNPQTRKRRRSRSRSRNPETRRQPRPRSAGSDCDRDSHRPHDDDAHHMPVVHKQQRNRHGHDGDYNWRGEDVRISRRSRLVVDEAPVLYKTYDGHVTGVKDFGIFVSLHAVRGEVTGLVHISRLADKCSHSSDPIKRGQSVKVKVISIDGARIGLSMKDVD